jgi:8-oxo-dGTP pyrophosphatase MutT (NUDIX family)
MRQQPESVEITFIIPRDVVSDDFDTVSVAVERPEWLYGGTFLVLALTHRLAHNLKEGFSGRYALNPLTNEKIPVWVSDYAGTEAHLGVPAHNDRDNEFARRYGLPVIPVVAQDFGEPLPDAKDVAGVVVIGYDHVSGQFMGLKNGRQGWLVSGGREEGEAFEAAARRELTEEAGFSKVIKLISLGNPVYSYYYNSIKKSNRRSLGYNYLAIVNEADQHEQQQEVHESFTVWWTTFDELYHDIGKLGAGHWVEALRHAKAATEAYDKGLEYMAECYAGEGTLLNSDTYNGLSSHEARERITQDLQNAI